MAMQIKTVSILLATTCSSWAVPAALRIKALFLGSTWWMMAWPPASLSRSSMTKSPTAGKSAGPSASCRSLPETSAISTALSVITL